MESRRPRVCGPRGQPGLFFIGGLPLIDSIYATILTLTPVGPGIVLPLDEKGKIFATLLILVSIGVVLFAVRVVSQMSVEEGLRNLLGKGRMIKRIGELKDHYIICGYGRMGKLLARELREAGIAAAIVEAEDKAYDTLVEDGYPGIKGDAAEEDVLIKAGIHQARGLVAVVASDAVNLFITMTARQLNPSLYILASAEGEASERKLLRAGANRVTSPYTIGAQRLAQSIVRPAVVDFVELATQSQSMELLMEEIPVGSSSPWAGRSLKDSGLRQEHGLMVVAIKKATGEMIFNPSAEVELNTGDKLVALGERKALKELEALARAQGDAR